MFNYPLVVQPDNNLILREQVWGKTAFPTYPKVDLEIPRRLSHRQLNVLLQLDR